MKQLLIFIFLSSFVLLPQLSKGQKSHFITSKISKKENLRLQRDAARLSLRLLSSYDDLKFESIEISESEAISIYNALLAVQLSDLDAAQVVASCRIHTTPQPAIDNFKIIYNRNVTWANKLREGINETTDTYFNELLEKYDLFIVKHVQWDETLDAIILQSSRPYNIAALVNKFNNIEGIEKVETHNKIVDGRDVEISRRNGAWKVKYFLKWGSCINGCDEFHSWSFEVKDSGEVTFLEENGTPVPDWIQCEKSSRFVSSF